MVAPRTHEHVSDGRLAVLLVLTGGIPLVISHHDHHGAGLLGFILAVVFVRRWVVRHEGRWALAPAAAILAVLCAVVVSYGALHPLWTASAYSTGHTGRYCTVAVDIRNAARVGVTIDEISATSLTLSPVRPAQLHLAPRADQVIVVRYLGGSGSGVFDVNAHYHVFGLALSETLPFRLQLQNNC